MKTQNPETTTTTYGALRATMPPWAASMIVAEYETDDCDGMTDYFATTSGRPVFLAWSRHGRDLFPELRKAAAQYGPTAHLGPGRGRYHAAIVLGATIQDAGRYYVEGDPSPWDRELAREFDTREAADAYVAATPAPPPILLGGAETDAAMPRVWAVTGDARAIEHREKYSMGHGYYLKAGMRYSSAWRVYKVGIPTVGNDGVIDVPIAATPDPPAPAPDLDAAVTVAENVARGGIEIRFAAKPAEATRAALKAAGWRWSRMGACWYAKASDQARAFAATLAAPVAAAAAPPDAPADAPATPAIDLAREQAYLRTLLNHDGKDAATTAAQYGTDARSMIRSDIAPEIVGLYARVAGHFGRVALLRAEAPRRPDRAPHYRYHDGDRVIVNTGGMDIGGRIINADRPPNDALRGCCLVAFDSGGFPQWLGREHLRPADQEPATS